MPAPENNIIQWPAEVALEQIVETVQQAEEGSAPFALVLGSGFSHGLVPTARELVEESLPIWVESLKNGKSFELLSKSPADDRKRIARTFWHKFVQQNAKLGLDLTLDADTGLPVDHPGAYKAAFSTNYRGAVGTPAEARKFQRVLMRLDQPRLNAAHFLLASLLGVQPGRSRRNDLFKARGAFCRLILTTNFDPFLQTALQAVNRLYFMSDTPELGVGDEILDEQTDAIHLVYLHGSIHRRKQAANDKEIRDLKAKNARSLAPVLKRHGVIVLGYSGWDDAIVEALAACDHFDHRLYWCGRESDPLVKGAFGPRVPDILGKASAVYVTISSAGQLMAQLCTQLVAGLPRLLDNPIGQLREMLQTIDLDELESPASSALSGPQLFDSGPESGTFVRARQNTIKRLGQAEQVFHGAIVSLAENGDAAAAEPSKASQTLKRKRNIQNKARGLLSSTEVAVALGNWLEALKFSTEALGIKGLKNAQRGTILLNRGIALYYLERMDEALTDWTAIIELSGARVMDVSDALINRALTWGHKGDVDKALADFDRVIEQMPGASEDRIAKALINRAVLLDKKGDVDKALADFDKVIEQMPGAPEDRIARALANRALLLGKKGDVDKALADCNRVIEQMPNAAVDEIVRALINRAIFLAEKASDKALADLNRVIEQMPHAPVDQIARALTMRGWAEYKRNEFGAFLADTEAALSKDSMQDAAAINLGLALLACGSDADALNAYRRATEKFPNQIQNALDDLREAEKSWLTKERAEPIVRVLAGEGKKATGNGSIAGVAG